MTDPQSRYGTYQTHRFRSLADDQVQILHEASLEILQRTGMRFFDSEALALFERGGASVRDGNLVTIPPHLVEWAIRTAPHSISIFNRDGRRAMALGDYRSYFGVGSDCMFVRDLESGQRRRARRQDVVEGIRLVEALPNMDFVMSMFLPEDVPVHAYEAHQMAIMLQESHKPVVFVGATLESTIRCVELAALVSGDVPTLARYPFIINYVNATSSFHHNQESVARLLYAAGHGIPTVYTCGNGRGTSAPFTMAGAIALGNAGQLAALVLSQLKREGSPFIRSNGRGGGLDFRTMVDVYAVPDPGGFGWDVAHQYGIPIFGTAGCTDAKLFDAQAAAEAALSLFANAIGGANLIHDCGYMNGGMTGSLELVAFCDELIGWVRRFLRQLEISEESLALDLIHQVGPDGLFLETEHTLRHCREDWAPTLMDRRNYEGWVTAGSSTAQERANQRVRRLIETHPAEPAVPAETCARLAAAILQAEASAP